MAYLPCQEVVVVLQGLPSDLDSEVELVRTERGAGAGSRGQDRLEGAGQTDNHTLIF